MAITVDQCPNCFQNIRGKDTCPYCGYYDFERKNHLALPVNVTLKNRYLAGRILGSGGFGITYKSYDKVTHEYCAIKEYVPLGYSNRSSDSITLTATSADKEEIYEYGKNKFLEEASMLSSLSYIPSVVKIYDCFLENGTAYFVMEYIDGMTLNRLRKDYPDGKVPFPEACRIIESVGECLHEVHTKANIFHRDISPENIMVRENGDVRLIDFGTAKYIHGRKTQNLSVVLKPGYAPPEQYSSKGNQGEYTDVYALAATFYVVLTGKRVPASPDRIGGSALVEPLWTLLGEEYRELSHVLDKALEVKISNRTQTMEDFLKGIRRCKERLLKRNRVISPDEKDKDSKVSSGNNSKQIVSPIPSQKFHPYLDGLHGPLKGYRYPLPVNQIVTIGRLATNNIIVPERVVGRRHLEIFFDTLNGYFYLFDNDSVNGTYVNRRRCRPSVIIPVKPGSIVSLAQNVCVFQLGVADE